MHNIYCNATNIMHLYLPTDIQPFFLGLTFFGFSIISV